MATPAYNYVATPEVIRAAGSEGLFSALQLFGDVPQVRRELYQKNGFRTSEFMKMKELGLQRKVSGPNYSHYEQGDSNGTIVVGAVTTISTGVNTPVVFSLKAESMRNESINGVAVRYALIQEQDILDIPSTRKKMIVTNVDTALNPWRVTVKPLDPTLDLATYVVANVRFYVGTNAWAEASGGAKSIIPTQTKWTNNCQIIKSKYVETGSMLTNELPWSTPKGTNMKLLKYAEDAEKRQYNAISIALLTGEKSANVTQSVADLSHDPVVRTTQGLVNYADTYASDITHPASGLGLDHFDSIAELVRRNKMNTKSVLSKMGSRYRTQLENVLLNYFDKNSLQYLGGKFSPELFAGSSAEDYFAWIGFKGIHKDGLNFVFDTVDEFDDINGLGATGYNYADLGIHLPWGTVKNKGDNKMIPSIGYVSKEFGGYNRDMEYTYTGSANLVNATDNIDVLRMDIRSEIGFEGILGSQWVFDQLA